MANGLFGDLNALYQEKIGQPFVRSPIGQGIAGYLGLDPADQQNVTEAYMTGQALSNTPGVGAPAGLFKATTGALGLAGAALIGPRAMNPATRGMFKKIQELVDAGATRQDITKVFPNASLVEVSPGQYAVEISDKASAFMRQIKEGTPMKTKLGDMLSHEKLFKEYPELKDVPINLAVDKRVRPGFPRGSFDYKTGGITAVANNQEELLGTLTHEIEHWIQNREMWPRGGQAAAMKVGLGAYKNQIAATEKGINDFNALIAQTSSSMNAADPKEALALQQTLNELTRKADVLRSKLDTYKQLEKYPDTHEGRFAAYADLWGERAARAATDRRMMTEQQRLQQPLQDYIGGGIVQKDLTREAYQGDIPIQFQTSPVPAKDITKPLVTEDPLNKGMKIVTPQDLIPYGDLYPPNPLNLPYGNAP